MKGSGCLNSFLGKEVVKTQFQKYGLIHNLHGFFARHQRQRRADERKCGADKVVYRGGKKFEAGAMTQHNKSVFSNFRHCLKIFRLLSATVLLMVTGLPEQAGGQTPTGWPGCMTSWPTVQLTANYCLSGQWELAFEDQFSGTSLNTAAWVPRTPWGDPPDHSTYNLPSNIVVANGNAQLKVKLNPGSYAVPWCSAQPAMTWYDWTGAEMWTYDKFQYGRFEMKCTIPRGVGYWPAFWLYASTLDHAEEIDIFEFWNEWISYWLNWINWDKMSKNQHLSVHHCTWEEASSNMGWEYWTGSWIFSFEWDPFTIRWYVRESGSPAEILIREDYHFYDASTGAPLSACGGIQAGKSYQVNTTFPTIPMKLIASFKMGWDNMGPNSSTPGEGTMVIDYIRVYRKKDCSRVIDQCSMGDLNEYPTTLYAKQISFGNALGTCSTVIQGIDQHLIASEKVILKPGFHIKPALLYHVCGNTTRYSKFTARIEACPGAASVLAGIESGEEGFHVDSVTREEPLKKSAATETASHAEPLKCRLFPNPARDRVNLIFSRPVQIQNIEVFNSLGIKVGVVFPVGTITNISVPVTNVPGICLITIYPVGHSIISEKVMVE